MIFNVAKQEDINELNRKAITTDNIEEQTVKRATYANQANNATKATNATKADKADNLTFNSSDVPYVYFDNTDDQTKFAYYEEVESGHSVKREIGIRDINTSLTNKQDISNSINVLTPSNITMTSSDGVIYLDFKGGDGYNYRLHFWYTSGEKSQTPSLVLTKKN